MYPLQRKILGLVVMNAVNEGGDNGGGPSEQSKAPPVIPTENKEASYHFKKEKIKDEKGQKIGEGKKHPTIKAVIPVPNAEGLLNIVAAGGKELELLQDLVTEAVTERGRQLINAWREANPDKEVPQSVIDASQLSWSVIANLPKAERRGLGISDEDWEEFFTEYRNVMPLATGKDLDRIERHVAIYKKKFSTVRNDKKALGVLRDNLNLFASSTPSMEDVENVYEYLSKRVDTLLAEDEKVLAEAL